MAHGVAFICALVVSAAATRAPPGSWSTGSASGLPYSSFTCDVDGGVCYITGGFVSNQNGPYGTECATPAACVVLPGSNGSCPTMYAMQFGHMAHTSIVVNGSCGSSGASARLSCRGSVLKWRCTRPRILEPQSSAATASAEPRPDCHRSRPHHRTFQPPRRSCIRCGWCDGGE